MRRQLRLPGITRALVAVAATWLAAGCWPASSAAAEDAGELLALGVAPMPEGTIVHIVAKMRTPPADNFSAIAVDCDFVAVEIWKQFGQRPKWRVEKPGRVAVMDGQSTALFIKPDDAVKFPHPSKAAFDTGPLLCLTTLHEVLGEEILSVLLHGGELKKIGHETTAAGRKKLVVTVEAKAGLPDADYVKNKFLGGADMRRTYRFDAASGRLEAMEGYLHQPAGDVLVLKVERVEYDQHADPALFSLTLPKNVQWLKDPEPLPDNRKYEQMTPKEAARTFFEACAKQDWNEAEKFWGQPLSQGAKEDLGGLQVLKLGEPFRSAISMVSGHWFVPYEIKLKGGQARKWNLALRKHDTAKRYLVDGGI